MNVAFDRGTKAMCNRDFFDLYSSSRFQVQILELRKSCLESKCIWMRKSQSLEENRLQRLLVLDTQGFSIL